MGISITYTATCLDDIAEMFDQRRAEADRRVESARKASDKDEAGIEARIWRRAADILRSTTLTVHNPSTN